MENDRNLSLQTIQDILALYSFGECVEYTPFTSGTVQTNLLLQTATRPCVLRYYAQGRSLDSVRFEINLLRYLKKRDYPCPAPHKNRQGRYVGMHDGKPYALFEFREGGHVENPTEAQKSQLIEQAATLHKLTQGYRPRYRQARLNYNVASCQTLAEQAARQCDTPAANAKLAWHRQELARLQLPASLPKGICHGDFHFSNILFCGDSFSALLDFDDANYTYLLFDLVGLIESWAWAFGAEELNFPEARKILTEYIVHRPLNANEKRHLFDVYKLSVLIDCVWYFGRGEGDDFYEKRKIDFLDSVGRERFVRELFGI